MRTRIEPQVSVAGPSPPALFHGFARMTSKAVPDDLPDQFVTARLRLRIANPYDAAALNAVVVESVPRLRPWMPWAVQTPSIDDTRDYCEVVVREFGSREGFAFLMFDRQTGGIVGAAGLVRPEWTVPRMEIGYWIRESHEGRGLVAEAVRGLIDYAFDQFAVARLEIRADDANVRSCQVPERLGFRLEGIMQHDGRNTSGELCSTRVYAITSRDQLPA